MVHLCNVTICITNKYSYIPMVITVFVQVTVDYNGGFQSAVAGLRHLELQNLLNSS